MLDARDVSISIGRTPIVHGTSLSARAGEVLAIVGPNGSGKTTLMRALSGDLGYRGSVNINGFEVAGAAPWRLASMRGVLPQASSLSFPFTVREIVGLGLEAGRTGAARNETASLPERALAVVDLEGFAGRFYQELSGGEQQRVQLARVLCQVWSPVLDGVPRYLFLDEPVSSLDIRHQLVIMDIARDFARRGGGVVAILHDLNLTAMYADSVLVMERGRGVALGTPAEVLTDTLLERVFGCALKVGVTPPPAVPFVLPQSVGL